MRRWGRVRLTQPRPLAASWKNLHESTWMMRAYWEHAWQSVVRCRNTVHRSSFRHLFPHACPWTRLGIPQSLLSLYPSQPLTIDKWVFWVWSYGGLGCQSQQSRCGDLKTQVWCWYPWEVLVGLWSRDQVRRPLGWVPPATARDGGHQVLRWVCHIALFYLNPTLLYLYPSWYLLR